MLFYNNLHIDCITRITRDYNSPMPKNRISGSLTAFPRPPGRPSQKFALPSPSCYPTRSLTHTGCWWPLPVRPYHCEYRLIHIRRDTKRKRWGRKVGITRESDVAWCNSIDDRSDISLTIYICSITLLQICNNIFSFLLQIYRLFPFLGLLPLNYYRDCDLSFIYNFLYCYQNCTMRLKILLGILKFNVLHLLL